MKARAIQKELGEPVQREVEKALASLLETPGILGARIIFREGQQAHHRGVDYGHMNDFSVLAASLLNGGEFLLHEIGHGGDVRVILKSDTTRVHLSSLGDEYFLATVADIAQPWHAMRPAVQRARRQLMGMLRARPHAE